MMSNPLGHSFYLLILIAVALVIPEYYFDPEAKQYIFIIGIVAVWRYSWAVQHFIRAYLFLHWRFPNIRKQEQAVGDAADPLHMFFLVTSFRIDTNISIEVYRSVVKEAIACGVPATVVASVVEMSDERLAKHVFLSQEPPGHVQLKLVRIAGSGKRDGLAAGLRSVSTTPVLLAKSVVAVVDGDSVMLPGCTRSCFRLFALHPKLGALTTNEEFKLAGDSWVDKLYRNWYNLRFAQRHEYMCSVALSRRVMTLTGRMSMFRGDIVGEPDFIDRIEFDYIDHWRLGRFRFLTGDDKSSWFQVLKDGWEMMYVPDVKVLTYEVAPSRNFLTGATQLMRRWFGNMLRTNSRARKLPVTTVGPYVWWLLRDQLISIWTALIGVTLAIMGIFTFGAGIAVVFFLWVLFTRYTLSLMLSIIRGEFSMSWPLLLYFNQVFGSVIKAYILNHLYKQQWTRQKTEIKFDHSAWQHFLQVQSSNLTLVISVASFLSLMGFFAGFFMLTDVERILAGLGFFS